MQIKLSKKPVNPIIIEGFPGFGLVGTIATEFLIDHLDTEFIGKFYLKDLSAIVAIHDQKVIAPIGIHYDKKHNIVIIHAITATQGTEWIIADAIIEMAHELKAKEIICLEGVGSSSLINPSKSFYYSNDTLKRKKFEATGIEPLKEGIIMGVTSALLLKEDEAPVSAIFSETASNLPDSKAAAKIIQILDKYLGLEVDYKPLMKAAESFENKIKGILEQSQNALKEKEKKQLSYVG